jgi:hypothetical protein
MKILINSLVLCAMVFLEVLFVSGCQEVNDLQKTTLQETAKTSVPASSPVKTMATAVTGEINGQIIGSVTENTTGLYTGKITGEVTGDITGTINGDINGSIADNITGSITGNVIGNIPAAVTVTTNVTASATLPPITSGFMDKWGKLVWGIIGLLLGAAIMLGIIWVMNRGSDDGSYDETRKWRSEAEFAQRQLKTYEKTREKFARYESLDSQSPVKRQQSLGKLIEIDAAFPKLVETNFPDLLKEPSEFSGPYDERIRALDSIFKYFNKKFKRTQVLKQECLDLLRDIEKEEPDVSETLKATISTTAEEGLTAIKPLLLTLKTRTEKLLVSEALRTELETLGKSVEGIRDYSFRMVPSRLLKFATELIEHPVSQKENLLREKVVREVIALINQYLKL